MGLRNAASIPVPGSREEADSFAACLQAVLTDWQRDESYSCICGLSGAAFSPAFRHSAECASAWTVAASDARIEFLGHALGFRAELRRATGEAAGDSLLGKELEDVRRRGGHVLCRSERSWGIVTGWQHSPPAVRLALPGRGGQTCTLTAGSPLYVLHRAERSLTRCESLRDAMRFGARVASGDYHVDGCAYGGRLYEAWLERLAQECFCPACGDQSWRCAERTASRARATQLAAAAFVAQAKAFLPPLHNNACADAVARAYSRMAEKLDPYGIGSGLDRLWADAARREDYVQDVAAVRELHRTASHYLSLCSCLL
jgi:hypothetical protein